MLNRTITRYARIPSRQALAAGAGATAIGFGVKAFYSQAGADELLWILAPSAWLARLLGGIDLEYEAGAGFISHAHHLVVGPACAGINFLVICFLALYFSFAGRSHSKARWLGTSAAIALGAAVVANALRIVVSAYLWDADIYGGWMTPGRIHRLAGTTIYYVSLVALYLAVDARKGTHAPRIVPLVWYLAVSLGVPLAGRLVAGGPSSLAEHALWVAGTAGVLTILMFLPSAVRNRLCLKS